MIKVKLGELINSSEALSALVREKIPVKLSYQIAKMLKSCEEEGKHFDELRKQKADELEIKAGKNNMYEIPPEKVELFKNAIEELGNIEVEIYGEKIDIEQLGDIKFESIYTSALLWLFV